MEFTDSQTAAVRHFNGPMAVIAGPGSGKTAVITGRINNLIKQYHISPDSILALTFTKAAALNMQERFSRSSIFCSRTPVFGTFHSVFFRLLNEYTGRRYTVISDNVKYKILSAEINRFHVDQDKKDFVVSSLINALSKAKNSGKKCISPSSFYLEQTQFETISSAYDKVLLRSGYIDYDDILIRIYKLMKNSPEILKKITDKFRFIIVDEFQDVNLLQFEIIKLLAGESRNIFVVGDDDQSIYGFRGSTADIFNRFAEAFPDMKTVILDKNFRCGPSIVQASSLLINNNRGRILKSLKSCRNTEDYFSILQFKDSMEEYEHICHSVSDRNSDGIPYSEMAVLVRNSRNSKRICEFLKKYGIPFCSKINIRSNQYDFICKDISAYLSCASDSSDLFSFARIINKPYRGLSYNAVDFGISSDAFTDLYAYYAKNSEMLRMISDFKSSLVFLNRLNSSLGLEYILNALGYRHYLEQYISEHEENKTEIYDIIAALKAIAVRIPSPALFRKALLQRSEHEEKNNSDADNSGIRVMSMHASKGLEFDTVFLPDLNKGIIPSGKIRSPEELEEERRILYVAMTRAKNYLCLSYLDNINNKQTEKSVFIEEILQSE